MESEEPEKEILFWKQEVESAEDVLKSVTELINIYSTTFSACGTHTMLHELKQRMNRRMENDRKQPTRNKVRN